MFSSVIKQGAEGDLSLAGCDRDKSEETPCPRRKEQSDDND